MNDYWDDEVDDYVLETRYPHLNDVFEKTSDGGFILRERQAAKDRLAAKRERANRYEGIY